jgi:hypothetical protein
MAAAHLAGHQRTLEAIATLWEETLRITDWLPLYAAHSDTLLDEELATDERFLSLLANVDEHEQAESLDGSRVDKVRPFIGEYLYSHFFAYRAFTGRVAALLLRSHRAGRTRSWRDDSYTKQLLVTVLGAAVVNTLRLELPGRIRRAQGAIERQMVEHIAKVLSGEASASFNMKKAHEITAVARTPMPAMNGSSSV